MSDKNKSQLSIQERAMMLMHLMRTGTVPTTDAKHASRILESLLKHQPNTGRTGTWLYNKVTGVDGSINKQGSVNFTVDGSFRNPTKAHSALRRLGIQASVGELLDAGIIPKNELPKGATKAQLKASRYNFHPLQDDGDIDRGFRNAIRRRGPTDVNRRAALYNKLTKGAFQAHPNKDGEWAGHGQRLSRDRWQGRQQGGKFAKQANYDPIGPVRRLGDKAKQTSEQPIYQQLPKKLLGIALSATKANKLMIANDIVKGLTGKGYDDWFRDTVDSATDKLNKGEAWKNSGYTPSVGPMY